MNDESRGDAQMGDDQTIPQTRFDRRTMIAGAGAVAAGSTFLAATGAAAGADAQHMVPVTVARGVSRDAADVVPLGTRATVRAEARRDASIAEDGRKASGLGDYDAGDVVMLEVEGSAPPAAALGHADPGEIAGRVAVKSAAPVRIGHRDELASRR